MVQVAGGERVEADHVYVIKPGTSLGISEGALVERAPHEPHYRARPINAFFAALAADQRVPKAGIVLSGNGEDGSAGLAAIRAASWLCLVQDPATAEYDGMPRSAIDTGVAGVMVRGEWYDGEDLETLLEDAARPYRQESEAGDGG